MARTDTELQALALDFRPASLEIMETAPSPLGLWFMMAISALIFVLVGWSIFSTVDVVAVAQGRVIPSGRVKLVQSAEAGIVRALHVHEGQTVHEGEALIELDVTAARASREQVRQDLLVAELDRARLSALAVGPRDPAPFWSPPENAPAELVEANRRLMLSRASAARAEADAADAETQRRRAERRSIEAQVAKLESALPLIGRRVEARRSLVERQYGAEMPFLELRQQQSDMEHDLTVMKTRLQEADSGILVAEAGARKIRAEFLRQVETELAESEKKAATLTQELLKAEQRLALQVLTAPVEGTVQQLQANTVGGVVTQGQTAMVVVPAGARLEIEALIANKDIGFVEVGQPAVIKLETFNFTKYGFLTGKVLSVSPDAIEDKNQGLVYAARIELDRDAMQIDGRRVPLGPGMSASVEIKTGERRLIEYVMAPLIRYRDESLKER